MSYRSAELVDANGITLFNVPLTTITLLALVVSVTAVALIFLMEEYGPRRDEDRSSRQQIANLGKTNGDLPQTLGPIIFIGENHGTAEMDTVRSPNAPQPPLPQQQPPPSQEVSLQDAASKSGIDIRVIRSWAEQQRLKTAKEELRRAILQRLIDLEASKGKDRADK